MNLTEREKEVIKQIPAGKTTQDDLAAALVVSKHTVKNHLNSIYKKLGLRNIVELALWAERGGLK